MSQNVSQQAQDMSQLSHKERIKLRNEIIIMQVSSGVNKEDVAKQFTISVRQVEESSKRLNKRIKSGIKIYQRQEWQQCFVTTP